jgi:hypothetical protein
LISSALARGPGRPPRAPPSAPRSSRLLIDPSHAANTWQSSSSSSSSSSGRPQNYGPITNHIHFSIGTPIDEKFVKQYSIIQSSSTPKLAEDELRKDHLQSFTRIFSTLLTSLPDKVGAMAAFQSKLSQFEKSIIETPQAINRKQVNEAIVRKKNRIE